MRRILFNIIGLLSAGLLASGCSRSDLTNYTDNQLHLQCNITRAGWSSAGSTRVLDESFQSADEIGIFLYSGSVSAGIHSSNMCYRYDGDVWGAKSSMGGDLTAPSYSALSYYPYYSGGSNLTQVSHSVSTNQSAAEGLSAGAFEKSDFCLGTGNLSVNSELSNQSLTLDFRHIMTKLSVSVAIPTELSVDGSVVTVTGVESIVFGGTQVSCNVNLSTGAITTTGETQSITPRSVGSITPGSVCVWEAILVPQNVLSGVELVTLKLRLQNGGTHDVVYSDGLELKSGEHLSLSIGVGNSVSFMGDINLSDGIAKEGSFEIYVPAGYTWTLSSDSGWFQIGSTFGSYSGSLSGVASSDAASMVTIYYSAEENTSKTVLTENVRTVNLTLVGTGSDGESRAVKSVSQGFTLAEASDVTIPLDGGYVASAAFTTNQFWYVELVGSPSWLSLESSDSGVTGSKRYPSSGTVEGSAGIGEYWFRADGNSTGVERSAVLRYHMTSPQTGGESTLDVRVTQASYTPCPGGSESVDGVDWAGSNLGEYDDDDEEHKFVDSSEKGGSYFGWDYAQTACPSGWRLPSTAEQLMLVRASGYGSSSTVSNTQGWKSLSGVDGRYFGDSANATGGTKGVFFPACGYVPGAGVSSTVTSGSTGSGVSGHYWSSSSYDGDNGYYMYFSNNSVVSQAVGLKSNGYSVRCVLESSGLSSGLYVSSGSLAGSGSSTIDVVLSSEGLKGGTISVSAVSSDGSDVSLSSSSVSVVGDSQTDIVGVTLPANGSVLERTVTVTFSCGGHSVSHIITQSAQNVGVWSLSSTSQSLATGSTTITSFNIVIPANQGGVSWSVEAGAGVTITSAANGVASSSTSPQNVAVTATVLSNAAASADATKYINVKYGPSNTTLTHTITHLAPATWTQTTTTSSIYPSATTFTTTYTVPANQAGVTWSAAAGSNTTSVSASGSVSPITNNAQHTITVTATVPVNTAGSAAVSRVVTTTYAGSKTLTHTASHTQPTGWTITTSKTSATNAAGTATITIKVPAGQQGVKWYRYSASNVSSTTYSSSNLPTASTSALTISNNAAHDLSITLSYAANSASSTRNITSSYRYGAMNNTTQQLSHAAITQAAGGVTPSTGTTTVGSVVWANSNLSAKGTFATTQYAYGMYFGWEAAKTACPTGWRLPTSAEFTALSSAYSGSWTSLSSINGRYLGASTMFWPAAGFANNIGSSATASSGTVNVGTYGSYWSSTEYGTSGAYHLAFHSSSVGVTNNGKTYGFSVRCVQQ